MYKSPHVAEVVNKSSVVLGSGSDIKSGSIERKCI
jgi:hypothetical protein